MEPQIMVIDDSLTVRKILVASLQRAGYGATTFPDGLQAMQALTAQQVSIPAAILLDVGLPRMDGYAVARAFKRQPVFQQVPIILLSGHTSHLDKLRGRLAGASASLTKPFQPTQVLAVLRSQLATHPASPQTHELCNEMGAWEMVHCLRRTVSWSLESLQ